jgi:hypothetical protein
MPVLHEFELGKEKWRVTSLAGTNGRVALYLEYDYGNEHPNDPAWGPQGWGTVTSDAGKDAWVTDGPNAQVFVTADPGWLETILRGSFETQMRKAIAKLQALATNRYRREQETASKLATFVAERITTVPPH